MPAALLLASLVTACVLAAWIHSDWIVLEIPTRATPLRSAARYYANNSAVSDIIVSMTTIPGREHLLTVTLKTLLLQDTRPAEIQVHVPTNTRWEHPVDVSHLAALPGVRVITHDHDLGPAMKVIPALLAASNPNAAIVYLDDDTLYPPDLISTFHWWAGRLPDAALTTRGWDVTPSRKWADAPAVWGTEVATPTDVDIVTGCGAVLVRPRFFNLGALVDYAPAPREAFFVDDIWLSGQLARAGTRRYIVPTRSRAVTQLLQMTTASLSGGANKDGRNNDVIIDYYNDAWKVTAAEQQRRVS